MRAFSIQGFTLQDRLMATVALAHAARPLPPLVKDQREALTRRRRVLMWAVLLTPLVLLATWPVVFLVLVRVWLWYGKREWRPARWLPVLEGVLVALLVWDAGEPVTGITTYATALLAWTLATTGHARAGVPLWDGAYVHDAWWLAQAIWLPVLTAQSLLWVVPGLPRLLYVCTFRPKGNRTLETPALAFTTAAEIVKRPATIIRGLWGSHFPARSLTMLHAREKLGKSTLLTALFSAFGDGSPFFGLETVPCTILYATEETRDVFREKAALLPAHVSVVCADQVQGMITWDNWPAVLSDVLDQARRIGARLVVIDTLGHWMPGAELGTVRAQQVVYLLKEAVAHGVAILLVHHDAKRGQARGPVALMAGMDRVMHLEAVEGDTSLRRLSHSGRFASHPPDDAVYRMDEEGRLTLLEGGEDGDVVPGEAATVAPGKLDAPCKAILAFLAGTPDGGAERAAISVGIGFQAKATYTHLDHLVAAEKIVVRGRGVRGDRGVYWLTDKAPSEVPVEELMEADGAR